MASLKAIKRRIVSVKNTRKITRAMKMVAAARLRRAQQRITDNTSGNSLVLQGGAGSNMKVTGYNYATNTPVPLYLSADGANTLVGGNMVQARTGYGLPKAMLFVESNGSIIRCYNGVTGASSGNCGFSVAQTQVGSYFIDFGFQVSDRFFLLTGASADRFAVWHSTCDACSPNQIVIFVVNNAGTSLNGRFTVIVF